MNHPGAMSSSLQGFKNQTSLMNSSNYTVNGAMSYAYSPSYVMRSSGYSFGGSVANNSNGFYPTAVSTPIYSKDNPNARITSKAEEMMKRTEEISKKYNQQVNSDQKILEIK